MRQITERDPQVTRQLQSSIDTKWTTSCFERGYQVTLAWLQMLTTLRALNHQSRNFPAALDFVYFFFFFFAAAVGPDENRERSKKV